VTGLGRVADLLRAAHIDPALAGERVLLPVVDERRRELGDRDVDAYADRLLRDPAEFGRLRERITVPETWLFRYPASFEALRGMLPRPGARGFRGLSVACATGAEPFSMVATALAAGIPADAIDVVAIDPSAAALERAATGRFARMAVRGGLPPWAAAWFREDPTGVTVDAVVRGRVRFVQGAAPEAIDALEADAFDAVFCRNLGIYLGEPGRAAIGRALLRVLAPGGAMFLGHAERPALFGIADRLEPLPGAPAGSFAHARRGADAPARAAMPTAAARMGTVSVGRTMPVAAAARVSAAPGATASRTPAAAHATSGRASAGIDDARARADAGQLAEALEIAERLHAGGDRSAALLELLGSIHSALGLDAIAEGWLRQAVYVDPLHAEALLQLAALAERRGDRDQAERYRTRAAGGTT
jgi:chemotaxis protein methyltransferase WspC